MSDPPFKNNNPVSTIEDTSPGQCDYQMYSVIECCRRREIGEDSKEEQRKGQFSTVLL